MWIMLTKKLPTKPSPPKMSLFWSTAWAGTKISRLQAQTCYLCQLTEDKCNCLDEFRPTTKGDLYGCSGPSLGVEPNWVGARKILFCGMPIRVFPHEFSIVSKENMSEYISSGAYTLVPDSAADENLLNGFLDGETKPVYDAALVDGCNHAGALATALGVDVTLPDPDYPAIGWYRLHPDVAQVFCDAFEMVEDRETQSEIISELPAKKKNRRRFLRK